MLKKSLAGWALLILALTLLVIGRPCYGTFPGTKGLPSAAERQTHGEGEGGRTQEEKAGGADNGEEDGRVQSSPAKSFSGDADSFNGKDGGLTGSRVFIRALQKSLAQGEGTERNIICTTDSIPTAIGTEDGPSTAVRDSRKSVSRGNDSASRSLGAFLITAYTAGKESTGKSPSEKDYGVTATGTTALEGRTISADWSVLPPGTKVVIEGLQGFYVVEDQSESKAKGGKIIGKHIDLFIPNLQAALEWGRQYQNVTVLEWGR